MNRESLPSRREPKCCKICSHKPDQAGNLLLVFDKSVEEGLPGDALFRDAPTMEASRLPSRRARSAWRDEVAPFRRSRVASHVACAWDRLLGVSFGSRSTITGGHHHRIDTFPCAETPTSRRGLMDSILNAATRGIISRGSKLFVTIAASLATAPLVRLLVHRGRSRRFDMIEYAA